MEIDISVIIPAFNAKDTIRSTLESIIKQDFEKTRFEVIVIDDGSTDDTADLSEAFLAKSGLSYKVVTQPNSGVSVARNTGMKHASGKYLYFIDADDLVSPECFEKMFDRAASTDSEVVYCGFDEISPEGNLIAPYKSKYSYHAGTLKGDVVLQYVLKSEIWILTGSGLFRRDFLVKNSLMYTEGCSFCEDTEFRMKALFLARRVSCVPESLVYYVQHPSSTVHSVNLKRFHCIGSMRRLRRFFERQGATEALLKEVRTYRLPAQYVSMADYLLVNNYSHDMIEHFISSNEFKKITKSARMGFSKKKLVLKMRIIGLTHFRGKYVKFLKLRYVKSQGHNR